MHDVRSIWSASADTGLIAPLLSRYPYHRKVGSSQSYLFSTWLSELDPSAVYDVIDYTDQILTGEDLYTMIGGEIAAGFLGECRLTKAQGYLLQDYENLINPPEVP